MDNGFILMDRLQSISNVIKKYGIDNFYISFSGGKDSTVLSKLVDMALPNNNIPRVYVNTGIDLNNITDFVKNCALYDQRIIIIEPYENIRNILEKYGYPFKSKIHSKCVNLYQLYGMDKNMVKGYLGFRPDFWHSYECPKKLKYQFSDDFNIKISDYCCIKLKEEPLINWAKNNNKSISIIGTMKSEGGRRGRSGCLSIVNGKLKNFKPLNPISKEWEDWFINSYNVKLCNLYYEPYNFERTGCKGCPFALHLQHELDVLEKYFPAERKQCEIIWKPIYSEYRRLNYRLKRSDLNEKE